MVFIGMGWCIGPGARVWRGVKPPAHLVSSKSCKNLDFCRFWVRRKSPYFDYPTMLGASGGLAQSCLSSSAFFQNPQKVTVIEDFVFFRKKSWAKMAILSPGPNVDRSRSGGRWPQPLVVGFRRFFLFFFGRFTCFSKKSTVWGVKKGPKTMVFEPRPQCSPKPVLGGVSEPGSRTMCAPMGAHIVPIDVYGGQQGGMPAPGRSRTGSGRHWGPGTKWPFLPNFFSGKTQNPA